MPSLLVMHIFYGWLMNLSERVDMGHINSSSHMSSAYFKEKYRRETIDRGCKGKAAPFEMGKKIQYTWQIIVAIFHGQNEGALGTGESLLPLWSTYTCFDLQRLTRQLTTLSPIPWDMFPSAGLYDHVHSYGASTGMLACTCLHDKNKSIIFREEIIDQRMNLMITICCLLASNLLI